MCCVVPPHRPKPTVDEAVRENVELIRALTVLGKWRVDMRCQRRSAFVESLPGLAEGSVAVGIAVQENGFGVAEPEQDMLQCEAFRRTT